MHAHSCVYVSVATCAYASLCTSIVHRYAHISMEGVHACVLAYTHMSACIWMCIHVYHTTWVHRVHTLMCLYMSMYMCAHIHI